VFAVCSLGTFVVFSLVTWFAKAAACDPRGHAAGVFLAYCGNPVFGDYEHGAYYLGLERGALAGAGDADVLFLGNSKLQYAFSTEATRRYFEARHTRYYLLGFGYTEQSKFGISLFEKLRLAPRVIVVNADPFFSAQLSEAGAAVMSARPAMLLDYLRKGAFTRVHAPMCAYLPSLCAPASKAIYREERTGAWILKGVYDPFAAKPIFGPAAAHLDPHPSVTAREEAHRLVRAAGIPSRCIVLTATPNQTIDSRGFARALAAKMNFTVILPDLPNMATIDGAHMHGPSAEHGSAAFLADLTRVLDSCAAPPGRAALPGSHRQPGS
jgi:hypothetical protein